MVETTVAEQAGAMATLLPSVMRQLFTFQGDLAAELPLAQLRVCGMLNDGPRAMSVLSRELGVSLSAMTQIADRLERSGLIKRVAEPGDRRIKCLQLTRRGTAMIEKREAARIERLTAVLQHLSPQARQELLESLEALRGACAAEAAGNDGKDSLPKAGL
jgi:DNA-binding MarR family transcriptional regulator